MEVLYRLITSRVVIVQKRRKLSINPKYERKWLMCTNVHIYLPLNPVFLSLKDVSSFDISGSAPSWQLSQKSVKNDLSKIISTRCPRDCSFKFERQVPMCKVVHIIERRIFFSPIS
jgi:hypothetical protein